MMSVRHHLLFRVLLIVIGGAALYVVAWRLSLRSSERAKEALLRQDLFTLRQVISQCTLDKRRAPQSLEDLKTSGYIRDIPLDPFTGRADWVPEMEPAIQDPPPSGTGPGIVDVHSASKLTGQDGTSYSTW